MTLKSGPQFASAGRDGPVRAVVRPERVALKSGGVPAVVTDAVFFGASLKVSLKLASGESLILRSSDADAAARYRIGDKIDIGWEDQQVIDTGQT